MSPPSSDPPPPGRVVVVTGPPGAGKSTVARLLADGTRLGVHLHTDDFWHFIRQGWIAPYLPQAHRQNEVVIDVVAGAAFGYAAGGYQVFCDGVVGPWFLGPFRAAAAARGLPLDYVVLRPDEPTTLRRATGRAGGSLVDPQPIRSLYRRFTGLGDLEGHVLDSTRLTARETADTVRTGLASGTFRLVTDEAGRP